VRGAPAIAIAGILSLAVEVNSLRSQLKTNEEAAKFIIENLNKLKSSRPTAVNLFEAVDRLSQQAKDDLAQASEQPDFVTDRFINSAEKMLEEDIKANKSLGDLGSTELLAQTQKTGNLNVLTHCNTGSLATAGYGTALGVIRSLHQNGKLVRAYCTETRPYNQGSRLTALELVHDKIPSQLITDSMAGALMQQGKVDAVVVGADRVTANGDTANKIGTYSLAVLCNFHSIPFFVAAPTTTLDPSLPDGSHITIEERDPSEITHFRGMAVTPQQIEVWNPAFDITPHHLITSIITEAGIIKPPNPGQPYDVPGFLSSLKK